MQELSIYLQFQEVTDYFRSRYYRFLKDIEFSLSLILIKLTKDYLRKKIVMIFFFLKTRNREKGQNNHG